ncbi:hypothetical protein L228DRAFT_264689 [Xylona heveae TC161]|uniref:Uncharacterized protein n=1 Tax=Xylona heveae (strain CBS 132557 / TC161) TaxID=1328760 RepID=A0A165JI53_XYLHT|nr:hypothetical protein L228DRAFT_264689 [Xylona heveae TC161]KZF26270.1 hypothetical protein L228DRAFT_264689 [Xylona heveae TC161]
MLNTYAVSALALALGANALVARDGNCCFHLTASGGESGTVGQLSDGQNRIGGGLSPATYCIDSNGGLTDGNGRGCILTPPTTQFQCDSGATPTGGFSVGCDGSVSYNGNSNFQACPTGENGEYNIYTTAPSGQGGCVTITLNADSCHSGCPPPPPKQCPADLSGTFEFPHLIVPIDKSNPDKAYGTSYNGEVTPTISSIFNFDIPASDSGKTCTLVFLFPKQSDLQTSSFTFSGSGQIDFSSLATTATQQTTYNNAPKVSKDLGVFTVSPGNSYTISTFSCPANTAISFELSTSSDTNLNYFQDYNPSPIGLYITVC